MSEQDKALESLENHYYFIVEQIKNKQYKLANDSCNLLAAYMDVLLNELEEKESEKN